MAEASEPKYGRRFIVNALLLALVWTLAWMWFNAHVKPHISVALFGGVSFATLGIFAFGAFRSFVDTGVAHNHVREWLRSTKMTPVLLALLPLLLFAYLTTFTVYLNAGKSDSVKLEITCNSSTKPHAVQLTAAERQKAVSYYFAFRPVTLHIATRAPSGYAALDQPLRRGIPLQLTVPDDCPSKPLFLVRLLPLYDLFYLRGRDSDPSYTVRVFVPGRPAPIERKGLSFRAIYLGASLPDLQNESKNARGMVDDLRKILRSIDDGMGNADMDSVIADWVDEPEFIATPDLKEGDKVRVELQGPNGTSETTIKVSSKLNDCFLKGGAG